MYQKSWIKITILFLLIATFLGVLLRYQMFNPVEGINFKNLLHTHSHIAFMGWIFNALFVGLVYSFIPKDFAGAKKYHKLFLAFQLSVLGMLFSFPFQGYGAISIAFSTLHVLLSVVLVVFFVRDQKKLFKRKKPFSLYFALAAFFFLLLSSFGPFALGYGMAKEVEGPFNQLAIYFYLHFQYDGWFTFAIFALFYRMLEKEQILYQRSPARIFFLLMLGSCIPAYAGSTLWTHPGNWVYLSALAGALAQSLGLWYFAKSLNGKHNLVKIKQTMPGWTWFLLCFAFGCFVFNTLMQLMGTIPYFADMAYNVRNFLIFYLHIIFLGFVSLFLFAWLGKYRFFVLKPFYGWVFLTGFIISQLLIVSQPLLFLFGGYSLPFYYQLLFIGSLLKPLSLLLNVGWNSLESRSPIVLSLKRSWFFQGTD